MRHSLPHLSVVITVRIDSEDRFKNLAFILDYLTRYFEAIEIVVVEQSPEPMCYELVSGTAGAIYEHLCAPGCFYRTRNLNHGAAIASRPLVLLLDSDVFFKPKALVESCEILLSNAASFVYPYNGLMMQIKRKVANNHPYLDSTFLSTLPFHDIRLGEMSGNDGFELLYGGPNWPSVGGAIMADRRVFLRCGGYNPNIISYGVDDGELDYRIRTLLEKPYRLDNYNCYHLEHRRRQESRYNEFIYANRAEFNNVRSMSQQELRHYVDNGFRRIIFDTSQSLHIVNNEERFSISQSVPTRYVLDSFVFVLALAAHTPDDIEQLEILLSSVESRYTGHEVVVIELGGLSLSQFYLKPGTVHLKEQQARGLQLLERIVMNSGNPLIAFLDPMLPLDNETLLSVSDQVSDDSQEWCNGHSDSNPRFVATRSSIENVLLDKNETPTDSAGSSLNHWLDCWLTECETVSASQADTTDC